MTYIYMYPIIILIIMILPIILFILRNNKNKKILISNIKKTKQQLRFKIIDTFYYNDVEVIFRFLLIEELESKKLYALKCDYNTYKKYKKKEINYEDIGSFWITNIINSYYAKDGVLTDNKKIKSDNSSFNISILNNASFVEGYAEFDKKNN